MSDLWFLCCVLHNVLSKMLLLICTVFALRKIKACSVRFNMSSTNTDSVMLVLLIRELRLVGRGIQLHYKLLLLFFCFEHARPVMIFLGFGYGILVHCLLSVLHTSERLGAAQLCKQLCKHPTWVGSGHRNDCLCFTSSFLEVFASLKKFVFKSSW